MSTHFLSIIVMGVSLGSFCLAQSQYLVKFKELNSFNARNFVERNGGALEWVSDPGRLYKWTTEHVSNAVKNSPEVEYVQKNHPVRLFQNPSLVRYSVDELRRVAEESTATNGPAFPDNPAFITAGPQTDDPDPLLADSWGLHMIGAPSAWQKTPQGRGIVVAITDTGIDYTHQDLVRNLWTNNREITGDHIDNDGNGFVDDLVGWDFVSNDNKPYDLSMSLIDILLTQGNPGHGTHVAGVAAGSLMNGLGSAGVAPRASLMTLRFINEMGQGDSAGAIKAIDYAVANGADIISASWGSEGEEEGDQALREAIQRAGNSGVLFVAAAGNGRLDLQTMTGKGYDNDKDAKPVYPASYPYDNIVAVAAISAAESLAEFSNYGKRSVDIAAPGVKVMSTVPGNRYQDTLLDLGQMQITWDGTSMATPHVAGALAVLWSQRPTAIGSEIKERLLSLAAPVGELSDKVVTEGRLELRGVVGRRR